MCGIYGVVQLGPPLDLAPSVVGAMAKSISHRGPDGCRSQRDRHAVLGIRLLQIRDPRSDINQPFCDDTSGVLLVCNGEIYNADKLRRRYPRYGWRTRSDVEPLLPLYLDLGARAFQEIDGMFAIAIWDPRAHTLILARDRAGEKPLFFAVQDTRCAFGSEIQALLAAHRVEKRLNNTALRDVVAFGYPLGSDTLIDGVLSVEAGSSIAFAPGKTPEACRYWHPWTTERLPVPETPESQLDHGLSTAVAKQLSADVPVGVFLSGGVDSSLLANYATVHAPPTSLRTFSVGFGEPSYDERSTAAYVAKLLSIPHREIIATNGALADELRQLVTNVAEPVVDPAVLPTSILAREARRSVGVVLSGEGADELFGGYPTYPGHIMSRRFGALPDTLQRLVTHAVDLFPHTDTKVARRWLASRFVAEAASPTFRRHVAWFGTGLGGSISDRAWQVWASTEGLEPLTRFMAFDYATYLRCGLLPKIDRATMLASLEARAPYLDPDVTRLAFALPDSLKVRGIHTKVLLKRVAARHLPRRIVHRRKRGLSVPVNQLMRTMLRDECRRHLSEERFEQWALLPRGRLGELVSQHESRRANHGRALWVLLVLGMWIDHWIGA